MAGGGIKQNNIVIRGGADGKTPKLKLENGDLFYSYDNTPWFLLGRVQGADGVDGKDGKAGSSLVSQVLHGQDADGGNIYLQVFSDGKTATFVAPKGDKGTVVNISQQTGNSIDEVMSQKATTEALDKKLTKNTSDNAKESVYITDPQGNPSYKKYSSDCTPSTIVSRAINGLFNVEEAIGSKHPVPKAQMEKYVKENALYKFNTEQAKQSVYITDPHGNQSYKKYTSEAYPSTIVHREASLDTFMVADPVYNGHPVTKQSAERSYFPIQRGNPWIDEWVPFVTFTYGGEDFEGAFREFTIMGPFKFGQKFITASYQFPDFSLLHTITMVPDTTDVRYAGKEINLNCSWYDRNGNPKTYAQSPFMAVKRSGRVVGHVFKSADLNWYFVEGYELEPVLFGDVQAQKVENALRGGEEITFYDISSLTARRKSVVMVQNESGDTTSKKYGSGPNTREEAEQELPECAGQIVAFSYANGRFNVPNPIGSLHPTNKQYVDDAISALIKRIEALENKQ